MLNPDLDWVAKVKEAALEPELPIVDPHHHLWQRPDNDYMFHDLLADTETGHNIVGTVFVDCHSMYRKDGPAEMRCVGETEFANGVAAMSASGHLRQACAPAPASSAMSTCASAPRCGAVFDAQIAAGNGRFIGIRYQTGCDDDPGIRPTAHQSDARPDGATRPGARASRELAKRDLTFDAWLYHPQLGEIGRPGRRLSRTPSSSSTMSAGRWAMPAMPAATTRSSPPGRSRWPSSPSGPTSTSRWAGSAWRWAGSISTAADAARLRGAGHAFKPWVETCIELFGAERCMFESNFPVDKITSGYGVLWNAFKRLAAKASAAEKTALFSGTASRVYKLALS